MSRRKGCFSFVLFIILLAIAAVLLYQPVMKQIYPIEYQEEIWQYAEEYRLDSYMVCAVIHTESRFRPLAVSRLGAVGLMQLMPDTAQWIAGQLQMGALTTEQILDPQTNIRLGTWYLADLMQVFDGRTDVVIAAYNGGRGQVNIWLTQKQWSGRYDQRDNIPFAETRQFLFKVRTAYEKYQEIYR